MTNSFPAVPNDFALSQIQYMAALPGINQTVGSGASTYFSGDGMTVAIGDGGSTPGVTASIVFPTPGLLGNFDQSTFETAYKACITSVLQAYATAAGVTLVSLQNQVNIYRGFVYASVATPSTAFVIADSLTYP